MEFSTGWKIPAAFFFSASRIVENQKGADGYAANCTVDPRGRHHVRDPGGDCRIVGNVQPEHQGKDCGPRPARHCPMGHQERNPADVSPHFLRAGVVEERRTPAQRTGHCGGLSDRPPSALQPVPGDTESCGVPDAQAFWQPSPQAQHHHCPGRHRGCPRHHDRRGWRGQDCLLVVPLFGVRHGQRNVLSLHGHQRRRGKKLRAYRSGVLRLPGGGHRPAEPNSLGRVQPPAPGEQVHGHLQGPPGHFALQGQGRAICKNHLQDYHHRRDGRAELRTESVFLRCRRGPTHSHHSSSGGILSPTGAAHRVGVQDHPGADGSQSG